MAEKNNAKCSICGKDYYLCLSCKDTLSLHPWRVHTCSSVHYQVYQIIRGYNTKVYTKEEARIKLKNVNLQDLEEFRPHIKEIVKDILKEEKVVLDVAENVEEVKDAEEVENAVKAFHKKRNIKMEVE